MEVSSRYSSGASYERILLDHFLHLEEDGARRIGLVGPENVNSKSDNIVVFQLDQLFRSESLFVVTSVVGAVKCAVERLDVFEVDRLDNIMISATSRDEVNGDERIKNLPKVSCQIGQLSRRVVVTSRGYRTKHYCRLG